MAKEEKNVFRDAKFGDKFLTRNGQVMIYQKQVREDTYCLFDEVSDCVIEYRPNGDVIYEYTGNAEPQEDDIVKKCVQSSLPSNLDEAASKWVEENAMSCDYIGAAISEEAFKAGAEWMDKKIAEESFEEEIQELYQDGGGIYCVVSVGTDYKPGEHVLVYTREGGIDMTQKENIVIPRWFLERIEDTLRIQNNINLDEKDGETCQDRNIKESLNGVRKLLRGEELTGGERLERLQPSLPSNLDEAANNYCVDIRLGYPRVMDETDRFIYNAFKAGAEWMAEQGETFNGFMSVSGKRSLIAIEGSSQNFKFGEDVIVQIRKKEE